MFWFIAFGLFVLASLFVILPLWRQRRSSISLGASMRDETNLVIFRERLTELELDRESGLLDEAQYAAMKLELERNLLADVGDAEPAPAADGSAARLARGNSRQVWMSTSRLLPLILLLLLPVITWLAYQQWGFQNELALRELYERSRTVEREPEQMLALIKDLSDYVEQNRDSGWAWYFLALNLEAVGQMEPASFALERASALIEQPQDKAFLLGRYALNEYLLAGQQMTEKIRNAVSEAQRLDPNQLFVLQILALDAEKTGDIQGAVTYWQRLLQRSPVGEDADFLREHIASLQAQLNTPDGPESGGPVIDVELTLSPELELAPETRVFVSALEVGGRGQPLAAKMLTVGDLPATISLDNSDAVGPFNLSSAELVYVVATVSLGGTATVQSGDYQARSEGFQHAGSHAIINLEISKPVE